MTVPCLVSVKVSYDCVRILNSIYIITIGGTIFMDNENLIDALERIKNSDDENDRMWFLYNLVNSKLVVPVSVDGVPDAGGNVKEDAEVRYFSIKSSDGSIYLVTFSCVEYFQEWQPNILKYHAKYDYGQVEKMVTREGSGFDGFVIDPNHANVALRNDLLNNITRSLPHDMAVQADRIVTEDNMGLVPAVNPPEKLVKALQRYMSGQSSIKCAYIMQTIRKGEKIPTLILVVDFVGSAQNVFEGIARVAQESMEVAQPIGIMPYYDKVAQRAVENIVPFYKK